MNTDKTDLRRVNPLNPWLIIYGRDKESANAALIADLIAHNVDIYVCGQSAAHYEVNASDLLPNVQLALSAMTAHALLQQRGYTLNP